MKGLLSFYRILSFILLPIAALIALFGFFALLAALSNPGFLLGVFMLAGIVIYVFTSYSFLSKGIIAGGRCKPSLRDWIRVNAFVSIAFAVLSFIQGLVFLSDKSFQKQAQDMGMSMAAHSTHNAPITAEYITQVMRGTIYVMFALAVLLLVHISLTFRLMRQHKEVFETEV